MRYQLCWSMSACLCPEQLISGFDPVAFIDRYRPAAAKASDGIRAGSQRADRIGCRINRGGSVTVEQPGPEFPAAATIMIPAAA